MFGLAFAMGSAPGGAAGGATGGMAAFQQIIPLVFMFAIFYFLLIRPQQKKAKEHKALLEAMKKGDNVITAGGVHGKVSAVENDIVTLEIANNVNIKITKSYIAAIKKD
ncbi:MAG: preprotein translocase subunit YajC [Desulfuromonadaceae bacterium]|nr:preprotein translocase subunit YajC [Desulfuromonadaceae bacterium]MDD2849693.1 preprotein translocase subunit YajC [Desulfuromonadaceae bacterium]MDD4129796.1 preprotein translocase subunit YajC [Desulfuromonadaceae bacterium]